MSVAVKPQRTKYVPPTLLRSLSELEPGRSCRPDRRAIASTYCSATDPGPCPSRRSEKRRSFLGFRRKDTPAVDHSHERAKSDGPPPSPNLAGARGGEAAEAGETPPQPAEETTTWGTNTSLPTPSATPPITTLPQPPPIHSFPPFHRHSSAPPLCSSPASVPPPARAQSVQQHPFIPPHPSQSPARTPRRTRISRSLSNPCNLRELSEAGGSR